MARRLPPLNALHAFEAAAHHLSFTKAADEPILAKAVSEDVSSEGMPAVREN